MSTVNQTACTFCKVDYHLPNAPCDRCGCMAPYCRSTERIAVDVNLQQPVLLLVSITVHFCRDCHHYFRAQPPFLRKDAIYSRSVVQKAVDAVYQDGMAMRRVPERMARDFWVRPSEGMIRQWCNQYRDSFDFSTDYQPWVVQEFSGILCVDEVYQGDLALLLAVDPASAHGDRLIGYQLVHGSVDAEIVTAFLTNLKDVGICPAEVITDGSKLYPTVLGEVWPAAVHQLCLFHETRRIVQAAISVIQIIRSTLPHATPELGSSFRGPLHRQPPSENPEDPAHQRWQMRQQIREAGIAYVHRLTQQGLSQRAIARQLGLHRKTVRQWLQLSVPDAAHQDFIQIWHDRMTTSVDTLRVTARNSKRQQILELWSQGWSYSAISREVGLHRVTVKRWLQADLLTPNRQEQEANVVNQQFVAEEQLGFGVSTSSEQASPSPSPSTPCPPPVPWESWEQVRQSREALQEHRFLLLRRPEHLNADEQVQLNKLLASPVKEIATVRAFVLDWYMLWKDENGKRRSLNDARCRYDTWRHTPAYLALPSLRRVLLKMTDAHFQYLGAFLQQPQWEATNNGAERAARAFRHRQAPHFNLRSIETIAGDLVITQCLRKTATVQAKRPASRSTRGRKPKTGIA